MYGMMLDFRRIGVARKMTMACIRREALRGLHPVMGKNLVHQRMWLLRRKIEGKDEIFCKKNIRGKNIARC
jgi:hypothetical protein